MDGIAVFKGSLSLIHHHYVAGLAHHLVLLQRIKCHGHLKAQGLRSVVFVKAEALDLSLHGNLETLAHLT